MNVGVSSRGVTGGDPPNVTFEIFRRVENALGTAAAEIFDSFLEHKDSDEHEHNVVKRRSDDIFRAKEEATGGTDPTHMFTFPPYYVYMYPLIQRIAFTYTQALSKMSEITRMQNDLAANVMLRMTQIDRLMNGNAPPPVAPASSFDHEVRNDSRSVFASAHRALVPPYSHTYLPCVRPW